MLGFLCPAKPSLMVPQPLSSTTALLKWEPATSKHIKKINLRYSFDANQNSSWLHTQTEFKGNAYPGQASNKPHKKTY